VDKKIADLVVASYKPCVLAISKWDLVDGPTTADYETYVNDKLWGFDFVPLTFISSLTGFNIDATFDLVAELHEQADTRVSTAEINKVLSEALARRAPQLRKSRLARIYFGMQVETRPPTILVYVNDIRLFNREYRRYLANRFREALPFKEVPLKIAFRGKDRVGKPPPGVVPPRRRDAPRRPESGADGGNQS
jgi:GTP-binding protein